MRTFDRVYYTLAAVSLVAVACLPWLVPLSYRALGLDPQLERSYTSAAYRSQEATASLRVGILVVVLLLALSIAALSFAALVLRVRRRTDLPWLVLALTTVGAAYVAAVVGLALMMGAAQISERPHVDALQLSGAKLHGATTRRVSLHRSIAEPGAGDGTRASDVGPHAPIVEMT